MLLIIPLLMLLFHRIQGYYATVAREIGLDTIPPAIQTQPALVIVPITEVSRLTAQVLGIARSLCMNVVAVHVSFTDEPDDATPQRWRRWNPGVPLLELTSAHHSIVEPILDYVRGETAKHEQVLVLIPQIEPRRLRHRLLHNQRGLLIAHALRQRSSALVLTVRLRLND